MKYLLENKFVAVLAAICLIATAAIPAGAQNAANNTAIANQNIRLLAADSIKKASTNSAEKTLQAAVKKDKDGNIIGTSFGSTLATDPYVPVGDEQIKAAEVALDAAEQKESSAKFNSPADAIPERPNPPRLVNDYTGILTLEQAASMENRCEDFSRKTSNQIVVVIVPTLYGFDKEEYARTIGKTWNVGQKKYLNGIVLLVKPKVGDESGEVFISTGSGLEGVLTDAMCERIIQMRLIPAFKENDYYDGINDALSLIFPLAAGEISSDEFSGDDGEDPGGIVMLIFIALFFGIGIAASIYGKKHGRHIGRGGGFNSGGGFGGPFIGGFGGSSGGGGGFSGFGGFGGGGGGFCGGGAGGSW
ncbi:MAG TPA: TPM domain-containing protein [Candidatus Egerieousia sp.]|nr:TPM domain-containing protein [Candidatus Egerieousia sp.]